MVIAFVWVLDIKDGWITQKKGEGIGGIELVLNV